MIASLLIPFILLLFGGFLVFYSHSAFSDFSSFGAGFMPTVIGYLIIIFAALDFAISWIKRAKTVSQSASIKDFLSVLLVSGLIIFYLLAVEALGFIATSSTIMLVLLFMYLEKYRLIAALGAIGLSTIIYFLFSRILLVPLPAGSLF